MSQNNKHNEHKAEEPKEPKEPGLLNHAESTGGQDAADAVFRALDSWLTAVKHIARGIIRHHGADTDGYSAKKTGEGAASGHTEAQHMVAPAKLAAGLVALIVVVWLGGVAYGLGGKSVVVQQSPDYIRESQRLTWANSDLEESKQDIANRERQIKDVGTQIEELRSERERYGNLLEEIKQVQRQDKNPELSVAAIGDVSQSSSSYFAITATVHNQTQDTLTSFSVYYQVEDAQGNVVGTGFAMGETGATCAPNADCPIRSLTMNNPSGTKFVPVKWGVTASDGNSEYGRYGADVMTKQF